MDYWEEMYQELKAYKEEHGNCNVSCTDPKYRKLGRWVMHQREIFKKKVSRPKSFKTREIKIAKLKALGDFPFETSRDSAPERLGWNDMYQKLRDFRKANGHCNPSKHDPNYKRLAQWVVNQRVAVKRHKEGKQTSMNQMRIDKLKEIDFYFDGHKHRSYEKVKPRMFCNAGEHDVLLCGNGGSHRCHTGNVGFRKLIDEHIRQYTDCDVTEKQKVVQELVKKWRKLDPPGRFLMRRKQESNNNNNNESGGDEASSDDDIDTGNDWYDVGDKIAVQKAQRILRDACLRDRKVSPSNDLKKRSSS